MVMYMNKYTGELLTYREMVRQFNEEYDGDDPTNLIGMFEIYTQCHIGEEDW